MNLGERCDEIVRLIDETLAGLEVDAEDLATATLAPKATVSSRPGSRSGESARRTGAPPTGAGPDRAAAGF
ncbi:MAG TPA: hypothetical protein VK283_12485 [Acidimicrobiales bacterium]|nr:hypothetical protein [Acidimicrobiales bacterium]